MPSSPISPCPSCPPHAAGGHGCAVYSSSVTDAQWAILEPLLPAPGSTAGRGGRPEKHCRRVIVDAILYIVRGGIAWRQLPMEFPPAGKRCSVDYDLQRRVHFCLGSHHARLELVEALRVIHPTHAQPTL